MSNDIQSAVQWFDELAPSLQTAGRAYWQTLKAAVLAQQQTNSAMREIAGVLRDFIIDSTDYAPVETGAYLPQIDSVLAQLQQ